MCCEHIVLFCCEVQLLINLFVTNRLKVNCLMAAGSSLYIQQVSSSYYLISPSPNITTWSPLGVFIMVIGTFLARTRKNAIFKEANDSVLFQENRLHELYFLSLGQIYRMTILHGKVSG